MPFTDPHVKMLADATDALMAAAGDFEVEAAPDYAGRMILTTEGGTHAIVDLRSVVWGTDGPPA